MAQYRLFLFPEALVEADALTLDPRESHHLLRVLRAKLGERVEVLDGKGRRYRGWLAGTDAKAARIELDSVDRSSPQSPRVILLQSVPKGKTMDRILRMATEIGAARIQPVFTDQGDVRIEGERLDHKMDKWRLTMIESCKQCGLCHLPELDVAVLLKEWLAANPTGKGDLRVVASLEEGSRPLREALDSAGDLTEIVVAVGPEGDFTADEYAALRDSDFQPVRLGANVLRAETAAAYILSVVDQYR